jgi:hypothetical protein
LSHVATKNVKKSSVIIKAKPRAAKAGKKRDYSMYAKHASNMPYKCKKMRKQSDGTVRVQGGEEVYRDKAKDIAASCMEAGTSDYVNLASRIIQSQRDARKKKTLADAFNLQNPKQIVSKGNRGAPANDGN